MADDFDPLDLTEDMIDQADAEIDEPAEGQDEGEGEEAEEVFITFADEPEDEAEQTPVMKRMRKQMAGLQRQLKQANQAKSANPNNDPEPAIPPRKKIEEFDYDDKRFDEYDDQRTDAIQAHAAWKAREETRARTREEQAAEASRRLEKQRKSLGVKDYDARSAMVKSRLSEQQVSWLLQAAQSDNLAKLVCALGGSEDKLDMISAEEDPAVFLYKLGQLSVGIKVTKKTAPAPESRVRGASASAAVSGSDKQLERLEKEAERSGDYTKVFEHRRQVRKQKAA